MPDVSGEVTKRLLSAGRGQSAHRFRAGGLFVVVLASLALVASLAVLLTASLPVLGKDCWEKTAGKETSDPLKKE